MKRYKWELPDRKASKSKKLTAEKLLNLLLENRGLKTKEEKNAFLSPKNPVDLNYKHLGINEKNVVKVLERITKAINENEEVLIYGDYDADGICSTAILWECLYQYSKRVTPHIPDRFFEGYGINIDSINKLKNNTPRLNLIICVDNGIVAVDAIAFAKTVGIDVIVVDHHEKAEVLPKAYGIIHSTVTSGAGLSWFLAKEIDKKFGKKNYQRSLELAAIGVIADQVPLVGINRSIVKFGISQMRNTVRVGLKTLYETSSIDKTKIGTYEIGYLIAPRINAMGRLAQGIDSLRLLCTNNQKRAQELAKNLNDTNLTRQNVVDQVVKHALKTQTDKVSTSKVIILSSESYHEGVIGLAASKLVEKFYLPSIVISKGVSESKGSARSIYGVNIIELIRTAEDLIIGGGGHTMAAGFSIKNENIEEFVKKLEIEAEKVVSNEFLEKKIKIDWEISLNDVSQRILDAIETMEPFGTGNPKPIFMTSNLMIESIRQIGADFRHIKMMLVQGNANLEAVGFGFGEFYEELKVKKTLQIAYTIERNNWNGKSKIQLNLRDFK